VTPHRCAIAGWGIVAPRSPNVEAFERNLEHGESWLEPFDGFGRDNFLVGKPEFELAAYRDWILDRFPPRRYAQIETKLGEPSHFALGAFIQALGQNPGLEVWLQELGPRARVYLGTGIGDLATTVRAVLELQAAQAEWDGFWARRDEDLERYLAELREIEGVGVIGEVESGKLAAIRRKQTAKAQLQARWNAPEPPWERVPAELLWNIHNGPAAQVSMLGRITGLSFAPVAACSTFGVALELAMQAIQLDEADAVVVGATDPSPHPLLVGGFYRARVISADARVSEPLTDLRGTHISGGAVVWVLCRLDRMRERGFVPLGLEPVAVGVSSDADHVITPSVPGPTSAIIVALRKAGARPEDVAHWDLHATATPGDVTEVETLRSIFGEHLVVSARKGTLGHGMSACGGWELTAQYLGVARGLLLPTTLAREELNSEIAQRHRRFVFDRPVAADAGLAGKLSMGVGGVNACVISRRWSHLDAGVQSLTAAPVRLP
jgi:3-oxoacyl-[acyl-carrier-protein] synthase II